MTGLATEAAIPIAPAEAESSRLSKVETTLLGRYLLPTGHEYPCQAVALSLESVSIVAPVRGEIGDRVIIYLEWIGRLEGEITRHEEGGFSVALATTQFKRDRLATRLTWLANREVLEMADERRHERIVPAAAGTTLRLEGGRECEVRIVDVSLTGAAVATSERPPLGSTVTLGKTKARVVRHTDDGIAVEFASTAIKLAEANVDF